MCARAGSCFPTSVGTIKEIYAHLDAGKETGAVSGFGSFTYKDTTVRYALESGSVTFTGGAESFPVALTLTSRPFRARLSGTASNTAGFAIDGDMQAEIDDGRQILQMDRHPHSRRRQLEGVLGGGSGSILPDRRSPSTTAPSRSTATRPSACLRSPREIRGRAWKERSPSIAWCSIPISAAPSREQASSHADRAAPFPFNQPLLQFIDADLRISAAAIDAGALKLGRGGFTITAKQGSVASEVGELELCGGSADGRLNVDLAQAKKQINLVANLADISLDACLEPLALALPIRGTGTLKTELASEGTDFSQLTGNLAGTLKLEAKDGAVPVDFARLATGSTPISAEGWSRDGVTAFDQLDADCQLGSGHIWCQSLSMQTPRGTIAGSGDVDVSKQTLDWSLTVANRIEPARPRN